MCGDRSVTTFPRRAKRTCNGPRVYHGSIDTRRGSNAASDSGRLLIGRNVVYEPPTAGSHEKRQKKSVFPRVADRRRRQSSITNPRSTRKKSSAGPEENTTRAARFSLLRRTAARGSSDRQSWTWVSCGARCRRRRAKSPPRPRRLPRGPTPRSRRRARWRQSPRRGWRCRLSSPSCRATPASRSRSSGPEPSRKPSAPSGSSC